jgi:hypothetical protein
MRLQRYLQEKYFNTIGGSGTGQYEIFLNPDRKEYNDLKMNSAYGVRFILDFKNKNFYVFPAATFHERAFKVIRGFPTFDKFWDKGEGIEWILTGDYYVAGDKYGSDALNMFGKFPGYDKKLEILLKQDFSWAKRYIDIPTIKKLIEDAIHKE